MRNIIFIICFCLCHVCAASEIEMHYLGSSFSISGTVVYPTSDDSLTLNKIISENDIYICMTRFTDWVDWEPELQVLANLDISQFSFEGPFIDAYIDTLETKFAYRDKKAVFNETKERIVFEDEGYPLLIVCGEDTLCYSKQESKAPYYFLYASLHEPRYRFRDMWVGRNIMECKIGELVSESVLKNTRRIVFDDYSRYDFWGYDGTYKEHPTVIFVELDNLTISKIAICLDP